MLKMHLGWKINALRELQSQTGEELDALLPSVLDRAFKGELQVFLLNRKETIW